MDKFYLLFWAFFTANIAAWAVSQFYLYCVQSWRTAQWVARDKAAAAEQQGHHQEMMDNWKHHEQSEKVADDILRENEAAQHAFVADLEAESEARDGK